MAYNRFNSSVSYEIVLTRIEAGTNVATIATQHGYVATLRDREFLCDFARPKKDMLRLCATQEKL